MGDGGSDVTETRDNLDSGLLLEDEAILVGRKFQWSETDPSSIADKLLKNDVVVLSLQDFLISEETISALIKHVEQGKGLILIGIPPLKALPSMPVFLRNFFEWIGYQPLSIDTIKRGFGFRIVKEEHTITHALNTGDLFRSTFHEGIAIMELKSEASDDHISRTTQLIEQRVILEKKGEEAGPLVIPALVVCEKGELKGRIAHFNFSISKLDGVLSPLINRAILWAGKIDVELIH